MTKKKKEKVQGTEEEKGKKEGGGVGEKETKTGKTRKTRGPQWFQSMMRCDFEKEITEHSCGGALPTECPHGPRMKISLPRLDLLGEERWLISQRRRVWNLFLYGLLLGLICVGIQGVYIKLINHCQADDQIIDNIQRTVRAYSESGSDS